MSLAWSCGVSRLRPVRIVAFGAFTLKRAERSKDGETELVCRVTLYTVGFVCPHEVRISGLSVYMAVAAIGGSLLVLV